MFLLKWLVISKWNSKECRYHQCKRQVWMKKLQDGWAFELERAKLKLFSVRFFTSSLPPRVFKAQV